MQKGNPVNFLVVGAARAGTTTLFEILRKHPGIFISQRKECRYFSDIRGTFAGPPPQYATNVITTLDKYIDLFKAARPDQLCGDISPDYLYYHENAVPKILAETNAQIPIIIILRNPIERAYSIYLYHVRDRREKLSFEDALKAEEKRRQDNWPWVWSYVGGSLYADSVKAYMDAFENVLVLLFEEDVISGRAAGKILRFLNLDDHPKGIPDIHTNTSGYPRNQLFHGLVPRFLMDEIIVRKIKNLLKRTFIYAELKRVNRKLLEINLKKENMKPETRLMLKEQFSEDVAILAEQTHLPVYKFWTDFNL